MPRSHDLRAYGLICGVARMSAYDPWPRLQAKRLRELEAENAKLKRLLGEAELDKAALKELVEGKC